jgi:RNA polymerase sigma-70 factor (ECF subfamily)
MLKQDAMLVAGVKAGDENAFTAVVERYQVAIGRYLLRLVNDPALAEDLCQETFFRAYRAIFKTDDDLALKPWLYRIATNAAYSALRRRRPLSTSLERLARHKQPHKPAYLERQSIQRDLVQRTLARLSPEHALPLLLNAVEGFAYHEIADIMGLSAEATRKRIYRAKKQFRAVYTALERESL